MARTGRPASAQKAINPEVLEGQLAVRATLLDVCDHFGVSEESMRRFVKKHYKCTFETLSRRFASRTRLSVRRFYLSAAMTRTKDGSPKHPGLLKDAVIRFGDMPTPVLVRKAEDQHEEELAAQQHAAETMAAPRSIEETRVHALLDILSAITKAKP